MTTITDFKPIMELWRSANLAGEIPLPGGCGLMSDDLLFTLAAPGGIEQANEETLEHLASCPVCISEWAAWLQAVSDMGEIEDPLNEEDDLIFSCGMLKAAAGKEQKEAVNIKSCCGRFILGIYPDKEIPHKAMVILEFIEEKTTEGKKFVVKDNKGNVLIDGSLKHGRAARVCENIDELDLSRWTLVEK